MKDIFLLDPEIVYLNHGSFGACPKPVFEVSQHYQRELERQPVEFFERRFIERMRISRQALARYVHAQPDDLVFVPNATTGLNIVARSLKLGPGDEILCTDHEYGALDRTWQFICLKTGASYERVALSLEQLARDCLIETIWSGVTKGTKVLFLSHITSPTALLVPLEELIRRARARHIITIIDGAHAPGQIPLDLDRLEPDFYAGNCHKWMLTPKGAAFLFARRSMQHLLEPLVVSWGWQPEQRGDSPYIDLFEWQGTRDISAYLAIPAAINFMEEHNWPQVQKNCQSLIHKAVNLLSRETSLEPISQEDPKNDLQMASFLLPPCDREYLKRRLYDDYSIEVPIISWNGKNLLRISIQGYNSLRDITALCEALQTLL